MSGGSVKLFFKLLTLSLLIFFFQNCSPFVANFEETPTGNLDLDSTSSNPNAQTPNINNSGSSSSNSLSFKKVRNEPKNLPRKLRLLNGHELVNTVESLTGYKSSTVPTFADNSNGFVNGDQLELDSNIFSSYASVIENSLDHYFSSKIKSDFSCFSNTVNEGCASEIIKGFIVKAFRKSVSTSRQNQFINQYKLIQTSLSNSNESLKLTLRTAMLSADMLYKFEVGELQSGTYQLTQAEKANFVSYTLTGDMPDEQLMNDIMSNSLTETKLKQHLARIVRTEKSKAWMNSFFRDWLRLDELTELKKNPENYSKWQDASIANALNTEFDQFINNIVYNNNGSTGDLLKVSARPSTGSLSTLYAKDNNVERKGVLTLASVMSSHSSRVSADKDKPVNRGILIKNQFLCDNIGIPSGLSLTDAEEKVLQEHPNYDNYTVRAQYEAVMNQGQDCKSCHEQFMPFGYMFSNFNALGEYQLQQKNQNINSRATASISGESKTFNNILEFIPVLADSENYKYCFSEKMAAFLLGNANNSKRDYYSWLVYDSHKKTGGNIIGLIIDALTHPKVYTRE